MIRTARALLLVLLSASALGCSSEASSGSEPAEAVDSDVTALDLRAMTNIERAVDLPEGGVTTVVYEPYQEPNRPLLFEAVRFRGAKGDKVEVSVKGPFPSRAAVVVTDRDFRPITAQLTERIEDVSATAFDVALPGDGEHFVLVRDRLWSSPMEFEVTIAEPVVDVAPATAE